MISVVDDATAKAIAGAFLAVAFADAQFSPTEDRRFSSDVLAHPLLGNADQRTIRAWYDQLTEAFRRDYEATASDVLGAIKSLRTDHEVVEIVIAAVRVAIISDGKIAPQEDSILGRVAGALGIDKNQL